MYGCTLVEAIFRGVFLDFYAFGVSFIDDFGVCLIDDFGVSFAGVTLLDFLAYLSVGGSFNLTLDGVFKASGGTIFCEDETLNLAVSYLLIRF